MQTTPQPPSLHRPNLCQRCISTLQHVCGEWLQLLRSTVGLLLRSSCSHPQGQQRAGLTPGAARAKEPQNAHSRDGSAEQQRARDEAQHAVLCADGQLQNGAARPGNRDSSQQQSRHGHHRNPSFQEWGAAGGEAAAPAAKRPPAVPQLQLESLPEVGPL